MIDRGGFKEERWEEDSNRPNPVRDLNAREGLKRMVQIEPKAAGG